MLVLSIHFPLLLLVPSDGLEVAWGWSGAALGWRGATLAWPGGWRGGWSGAAGVAWAWAGGGLGRFYYPGTIRDCGVGWLAGLAGQLDWLASAGLGCA